MKVLYLDASALVKLVAVEACSGALAERVSEAEALATSIMATVEVPRALARAGLEYAADALLARCGIIDLGPDVIRVAASLGPPTLRALDAIHVATAALLWPEIEAFVTYDRRQAAAAAAAGLPVESPGIE